MSISSIPAHSTCIVRLYSIQLKVLASSDKGNDYISRSDAVVSTEDVTANARKAGSDFWPVLEEMKRDNLFGQIQIAALRLATVMKDSQLTQALADYRNNHMDKETFMSSILSVAERVIEENC